jgi:hydrogenase-4 component B
MSAVQSVVIGFGVLVAGAVVTALLSPRRRAVGALAFLFVLAAAAAMLPGAVRVLVGGASPESQLLRVPTLGAQLTLRVDPLSALFLVIVSVISALTTLYSVSYMACHPRQHLVRYYPLLLLFFAGIVGLVCVADWFFFLIFWEFMTICSYFLVIFEKENPVAQRAGLKYMIMTHSATALMLLAVVTLWKFGQPHSFSFAAARETMAGLAASRPLLLHLLLAAWFLGFATKAGVLPFGDWLPDAYPAAPSSVSAAFGGSMTKLGIYGILRIFLETLPASDITMIWGVIIALFGTASIFMGTLSALAQEDSKRLMAFHVIGQIGYMLLAIGAGLYLLPTRPAIAMVALMAGVFHLVNHVCYKSLLFFNTGAILLRTGETSLGRVGGLWSRMPITAFTALVGSMSIAGLPPFNGFASKWLIYNVTVLGAPHFAVFAVLGVVAAFISLVTLASFLKFLGAAFLGPPPAAAEQARRGDVPAAMQIPQVVLAGLCVLFGLAPLLPLTGVHRAIASLAAFGPSTGLADVVGSSWLGLRLSFAPGMAVAVWLPIVGFASLLGFGLLAQGLSRLGAAERRQVEIWHCGTLPVGEQGRYPAHSFYDAFKRPFRNVYPPVRVPRTSYPARFMSIFDLDRWLFRPILRAGQKITEVTAHTHSGIPQLYLSWQIAGLILVVVALVLLAR